MEEKEDGELHTMKQTKINVKVILQDLTFKVESHFMKDQVEEVAQEMEAQAAQEVALFCYQLLARSILKVAVYQLEVHLEFPHLMTLQVQEVVQVVAYKLFQIVYLVMARSTLLEAEDHQVVAVVDQVVVQ